MKIGEVWEQYSRKYPKLIIVCNDTYELVSNARHNSKGIDKLQKEFDQRNKSLKELGFIYLNKEFVRDSTVWIWGIDKSEYNRIKDKLVELEF